MIKFFRKIRYELMGKPKTHTALDSEQKDASSTGIIARYLKYAIGEIVLVVIGILIALSINNWNQQRIATAKEKLLLDALHKEFIENKSQLNNVVSTHENVLASTKLVIEHFPINPETVNLDTLNKRMQDFGRWQTFNPSQGVIRSLVNTSSFELISNPELRDLLVSWEDILADYQEEELRASRNLETYLLPQLLEHYAWAGGAVDVRLDKSYFATYQFENLFYRRMSNLEDILNIGIKDSELVRIKTTIDRIIKLSRPIEI